MNVRSILVVNDDLEDIAGLCERLPKSMSVLRASHRDTQQYALPSVDLIVLDNDANKLELAKGPATLKSIRERGCTTPVIYTSFQPDRVAPEVRGATGVEVIRTTSIHKVLEKNYNIALLPRQERAPIEPTTSIIVTYNSVDGWPADMYGNGKLLVISGREKWAGTGARDVLKSHMRQVYHDFDWATERDRIKNVFVYHGTSGRHVPGYIGAGLGHDLRLRACVLMCPCAGSEYGYNSWRQRSLGEDTELYVMSRCGAHRELGMIADIIMGQEKAGTGYTSLPISRERILTPASRWRWDRS